MQRTRRDRRVPSVRARELHEELFPLVEGLNTVDAGHVIGVDSSTVRRYIRDGKLPAVRIGRDFVITEEDVRAFVQEKQARDKAERLEAARVSHIQREIDRYVNRARQAGQTSQVALAWCPTCGYRSPLTLQVELIDGMMYGAEWQGVCRFCPDMPSLSNDYSYYSSVESEEKEAARKAKDAAAKEIPDLSILEDLPF